MTDRYPTGLRALPAGLSLLLAAALSCMAVPASAKPQPPAKNTAKSGAKAPAKPAARPAAKPAGKAAVKTGGKSAPSPRSEEHTSELQSQSNLVCRLLLEKKNKR